MNDLGLSDSVSWDVEQKSTSLGQPEHLHIYTKSEDSRNPKRTVVVTEKANPCPDLASEEDSGNQT